MQTSLLEKPAIVIADNWTKREYQRRAAESALAKLRDHASTLCVMATGTGKTYTAGMGIIAPWLAENRGDVVWIAHLDSLIEQTQRELQSMLSEYVGREQGQAYRWESERVCVASVATLYSPARVRTVAKRASLIIYDEAHHLPSPANSKVIATIRTAHPSSRLVGLTATPLRHDGLAMGACFESVAIEYYYPQARDDGYLVPVKWQVAEIEGLDFSHLTKRTFTDEAVGNAMGRDEILKGIVTRTLEYAGDERVIMFFPTVHVAHLACAEFNRQKPGSTIAIDGTKMQKDDKKQRINAFRNGEYQIVCNVAVLGEGMDFPNVSFIGMAAPTMSVSTYLQQLGRGTRNVCKVDEYETADERRRAIALSSKPRCTVLDFVGNSGKLEIIQAIDVLEGSADPEAVKRAKKNRKDKPAMPTDQAIAQARAEIDREKADEARRLAEAEAARFKWTTCDPFAAFGIKNDNVEIADAMNRASPEQVNLLRRIGLGAEVEKLSRNDAQKLIRAQKVRESRGLANLAQIRLLAHWGVNAQQMYSTTAGRIIERTQLDGKPPTPQVIAEMMRAK